MNWSAFAERNWTSSHAKQWAAAMVVSKKHIRVNSVSDDTATQLRGAWLMWDFLRHWDAAKARELRRQYGYSRFYELFLQFHKFEMSPDVCVEYLESDLSNTAMTMQIIDHHDQREEWERNAITIYGKVTKLARVAYGAPEWFVEWVKDTERLFKEQGIK